MIPETETAPSGYPRGQILQRGFYTSATVRQAKSRASIKKFSTAFFFSYIAHPSCLIGPVRPLSIITLTSSSSKTCHNIIHPLAWASAGIFLALVPWIGGGVVSLFITNKDFFNITALWPNVNTLKLPISVFATSNCKY